MNSERKAFEEWYEKNNDFMINTQFLMEGDRYIDRHVRMAWLAWQASTQRQGYKLVPVDVLERAISHISIAMCHPNNTRNEEDTMHNDMVIIEEAMRSQMTIEEIRKGAPIGATHYWHERGWYFKIDPDNRSILVWVGFIYNKWMTPKAKLKMNKIKPLN